MLLNLWVLPRDATRRWWKTVAVGRVVFIVLLLPISCRNTVVVFGNNDTSAHVPVIVLLKKEVSGFSVFLSCALLPSEVLVLGLTGVYHTCSPCCVGGWPPYLYCVHSTAVPAQLRARHGLLRLNLHCLQTIRTRARCYCLYHHISVIIIIIIIIILIVRRYTDKIRPSRSIKVRNSHEQLIKNRV